MKFETKLAILLLIGSLVFYIINYFMFYDLEFIERYLLAQLGFLPISALLVSLVLNKIMVKRERERRLEKLNIVIGTFFADIGKYLLNFFSKYDPEIEELRDMVNLAEFRSDEDFEKAMEKISEHPFDVDMDRINLYELRKSLQDKREVIINMLDNPAIYEHEKFTDLLWGLLHLVEELRSHHAFDTLSQEEKEKIKEDIRDVYNLLTYEWINHAEYLRRNYPRMFSLAVRTNPFRK